MTHPEVVSLLSSLGYKKWGRLRKVDGSSYQCYRLKNSYAWLGYAFLECSSQSTALYYPNASRKAVLSFLSDL